VATVSLRFQPAPEHVRTARLVAVATARRAGLDEARLDEVRLAVGEVCARAVRRSQRAGATERLLVEMDDGNATFAVEVTDHAGAVDLEEESIALALVRGLADAVTVVDGPGGSGGVVCLTWRSAPPVGR
jgi:anti-sigma regulatory factor (Ser/Thr protein kinase)